MGLDRARLHREILGALFDDDITLFEWLLEDQDAEGVAGDLAEVGVFLGKSAIVIGDHLRTGERFVALDLFERPGQDAANRDENAGWYGSLGLSREAFEANYRAFHPQLPDVVQAPSADLPAHVQPGTLRFLHIDASHLYDHVRVDVASARALLAPDGVVVFDDYRSPHTPGVAAAVWEAVATTGLRPFLLSDMKMYASWSDASSLRKRLRDHLDATEIPYVVESVAGLDIVRVPATVPPPPTVDRRPDPFTVALRRILPRSARRGLRRAVHAASGRRRG